MDASKVCLWAFRSMLENSVKNGFLDDISSSLQMKLMHESEFDDGVSELLMIASKRSRFSEIVIFIISLYISLTICICLF